MPDSTAADPRSFQCDNHDILGAFLLGAIWRLVHCSTHARGDLLSLLTGNARRATQFHLAPALDDPVSSRRLRLSPRRLRRHPSKSHHTRRSFHHLAARPAFNRKAARPTRLDAQSIGQQPRQGEQQWESKYSAVSFPGVEHKVYLAQHIS